MPIPASIIFNKGLIQLLRKDNTSEERSFFNGPSTVKEPASKPTLASPFHCCILPSFVVTSMTEDKPPPKRLGKLLLYRLTDLREVLLMIETMPSRWVGLKMRLPSSKNTF